MIQFHLGASYKKALKVLVFLMCMLPLQSWVYGPKSALSSESSYSRIDDVIKLLVDSKELTYGEVSFTLSSLTNGSITVYQPHKCLTPASNVKLITTITALDVLGEDFRFKTEIGYIGFIKSGRLKGDIIIKGGGDPTLGSDRFTGYPNMTALLELWAKKIKEVGIEHIEGNILADPGIFSINSVPDGWVWGDIGNYFGAGASGININENTYKIYFKPGNVGESATLIRTEPEIPNVTFINNMATGKAGSGDNGYVYGGPFSNIVYLDGTVPAGVKEFSIKGAMPNAAEVLAFNLMRSFKSNGISVSGGYEDIIRKARPIDTETIKVVHTQFSPALKDIVHEVNVNSLNLHAEAIVNYLGKINNNVGSTKNGTAVVLDFLEKNGISVEGISIHDGSGLTAKNMISSSDMVKVLQLAQTKSCFGAFFRSLPVAGKNGTLASLCRGTEAEGKVFAKSGSFAGVLSYSGFIKNKKGELLSFSIIINNYKGSSYNMKKKVEHILVEIARS